MKKAINVKKGRIATTNEVIKFVFLQAVKTTAIELQESRNIELGNDVNILIEEHELHTNEKVPGAFPKK